MDRLEDFWWSTLPAYAELYIKPDYEAIDTNEDYCNFIHKYLNILEETKNENKALAIKAIIYPLYSRVTKRSYESLIDISC